MNSWAFLGSVATLMTSSAAIAQEPALPRAAPGQSVLPGGGSDAQGAQAADQGPVQSGQPTATAAVVDSSDIVVTAQRREQSILRVPLAISAVGGERLNELGISDATELVNATPNLTIASAYGKATPNFFIRGIGSDQNLPGLPPPVGVYLDDAYMSNRMSHGSQIFDVERIEVLRGPQGTLFGRNTTGGAINIISRKPSLGGSEGYAQAGYGRFDTLEAQGAMEATLIPDVAGVRVAGNYERTDGGFPNLVAGQANPNDGFNYAGRVMMRVKPGANLDVLLKAYVGRDKRGAPAYRAPGTGPNDVNPLTGYTPRGLGFYDIELDRHGKSEVKSWGLLSKIDYAVSDAVTLTSLTSYDGGGWDMFADLDGSPVDLLSQLENDRFRQFNQELRGAWSGDRVNLIVGGYYGSDRVNVNRGLDLLFFGRQTVDPSFTFATGGLGLRESYIQRRKSNAVFSQGDFDLTDRLTITAGIRYTWDRTTVTGALARGTDRVGNPVFFTVSNPVGPPGTPLDPLRRNDSAATGRAALTYTAPGGMIVYGSYSRGYRAGSFSGSFLLSPSQAIFVKPETVDTFEIGSKGRLFDRRVTYSAAAFYNRYKDQQFGEIAQGVLQLRNAGASTIYGVEFDMTATVSSRLLLRLAADWLHTRYDELMLGGVDLSGNELPYAPRFSVQGGGDWTFGEVGGGDLKLVLNANYRSRQWYSPNNDGPSNPQDTFRNGRLQQRGYALIDGSVSWSKDRLTLTAWGNNILAHKYYAAAYDLRGYGYEAFVRAQPGTYGLRARIDF